MQISRVLYDFLVRRLTLLFLLFSSSSFSSCLPFLFISFTLRCDLFFFLPYLLNFSQTGRSLRREFDEVGAGTPCAIHFA